MIARTAAILALCTVIAACSGRPSEPRRAGAPSSTEASAAPVDDRGVETSPPARPEPEPPEPPEAVPEDPPFDAAYSASAPDLEPPATIATEPRHLLGMTRSEVAVWLGPPNLRREEPRSEMWQYAAWGCVLHVFLYETGSPPERRVSHYEIGDAAAPSSEPCFETLLHRDEAARR